MDWQQYRRCFKETRAFVLIIEMNVPLAMTSWLLWICALWRHDFDVTEHVAMQQTSCKQKQKDANTVTVISYCTDLSEMLTIEYHKKFVKCICKQQILS